MPWPSSPPQLWALGPVLLLLVPDVVRQARGAEAPAGCRGPDRVRVGAAGPGPGAGAGPLPARLSAAPPAGPRQQRTARAARLQSADKRLLLTLLSFPPALTGEGPVLASREAGGPAGKLKEGAAPEQDALASVSLGPCHLPGRSRVPAARRVLCPEPRVYGVLLCAPRERLRLLDEIKGCPRAPGPPGGLAASLCLPQTPPGLLEAVFSLGKPSQFRRRREGEVRLRWQDLDCKPIPAIAAPSRPLATPRSSPPLHRGSSEARPWDLLTS